MEGGAVGEHNVMSIIHLFLNIPPETRKRTDDDNDENDIYKRWKDTLQYKT